MQPGVYSSLIPKLMHLREKMKSYLILVSRWEAQGAGEWAGVEIPLNLMRKKSSLTLGILPFLTEI